MTPNKGRRTNDLYQRRLQEKEIRLIKIEPSDDDEAKPICCSPIIKDRDDNSVKYKALSYVWGDQKDTIIILCDGIQLKVTRNLHEAMLHLRTSYANSYFWIDAICINQSDDEERSAQVRRMKEIYSLADLVIMWLGTELPGDRPGLDLMRHVNNVLGTPLVGEEMGLAHLDLDKAGLPARKDEAWGNVVRIMSRPWFSRVWIVQEFLSARKSVFHDGELEIAPEEVLAFAGNSRKYPLLEKILIDHDAVMAHQQKEFYRNILAIWSLQLEYLDSGALTMLDLLWLTQRSDATDSRDKVFALVGLADDFSNSIIDYKKSHREVLVEIATAMLNDDIHRGTAGTTQALDVLTWVSTRSSETSLPSWVPDWQYHGYSHTVITSDYVDADNLGKASFSVNAGDSLTARGRIFDHIEYIEYADPGSGLTGDNYYFDMAKETNAWLTQVSGNAMNSSAVHTAYHNVEEALWRTLSFNGGRLNKSTECEDLGRSFRAYRKFMADISQWRDLDELRQLFTSASKIETYRSRIFWAFNMVCGLFCLCILWTTDLDAQYIATALLGWSLTYWVLGWSIDWLARAMDRDIIPNALSLHAELKKNEQLCTPFENALAAHNDGLRFCVTARGYLGWCSPAARPGDEIACFNGSAVLYTLRKKDENYVLIQNCYIQGLMRGEAFKFEDAEERDIRIV